MSRAESWRIIDGFVHGVRERSLSIYRSLVGDFLVVTLSFVIILVRYVKW